ncbi:EpsG family protein [Aliivibrio fischeri]|uniref:EpsG family protein n=1 Tax=Aliivibrio fischeri TaxID=668 RepID=UPI0012D8991B|nr:EpsG family protein [Aliivibrio fischeri]MUK26516.1 hypothetical protein [Aliivibrio fischeri]MUK33722.1 hypothetical protein [Aliivibrio fischeri]
MNIIPPAFLVFIIAFSFIEFYNDISRRDGKYILINRVLFIFFIVILILLSGFRSQGVGIDDGSYNEIFLSIPSFNYDYTSNFTSLEIGFINLIRTLKLFDFNIHVLFFLCAVLSLCSLSYSVRKMSPLFFLSLLLFYSHDYWYRDVNQIRAAVAYGFLLVSLYFYCNKNVFYFLFFIFLASLFHYSSLFFLLVFFERYINTRKQHFLLLFISVIVSFLSVNIFSLIFNNLQSGYLHEKIFKYAMNDGDSNVFALDIWRPKNIKLILVFILGYIFWDELIKSKYFKTLFSVFTFGLCVIVLLKSAGVIAARLGSMFTVVDIILIPIIISSVILSKRKFSLFIVFVLISIVFFIHNYFMLGKGYNYSMFIF